MLTDKIPEKVLKVQNMNPDSIICEIRRLTDLLEKNSNWQYKSGGLVIFEQAYGNEISISSDLVLEKKNAPR